jgi:hypothetical protein
MKITKIGLIVISVIILIAGFVAQINRLISVDFSTVEEIHQNKNSKHASDLNINMGDSSDHLMWFMQVKANHPLKFSFICWKLFMSVSILDF